MSDSEEEQLEEGTIFDLLSNPRRRYTLYFLTDREEPIELRDLADEVAAWESDTPVEELTSEQTKRVYVSLYQTHIPKLEEAGVIDYNEDTGVISLAAGARRVETYLDRGDRERRELPWQRLYLLVAAVGLLAAGAVAFGVPPFATVPALFVHVAIVVTFAVLAIANLVYDRYYGPDDRDGSVGPT